MSLRFAEPAAEAYHFPLTIRHLLDTAMTTSGDREIVYRDQKRFDYRELGARIGRLASMLTSIGAEEGMTIAMMDWDSHRYLEAYFAVPMMGAVLQTVNVRLPAAQILYTLIHAKAEILLLHHEFLPLLDAILPQLPAIKAIVVIMEDVGTVLPAYAQGDYETLCAAASPDYPFRDFDENAIATTFYTTGTTGAPKGVCFTHRQLVLHTMAVCGPCGDTRSRGLGIDDVYMPLTPMFHVHAWGVPYLATMLGLKQVYPGRYEPSLICDLYRDEGVTYSHCVPTILQMVLAAAHAKGTDLTGWLMTIGGSALTPALFAEARARGMEIIAGYGMSETAPTISIAHRRPGEGAGADDVVLLTKAGVPVPLVSVRIVDENMNDVPSDGVSRGELVVRAPWLTPCYTGDAAASEALWRGGWLHTQDVASLDGHGNITIRDRLKDVIKSGGEWVGSLDIEDLVAGVEGVAEIAVIGVPDARWGERPIAIVALTPQAQLSLAALNAPIDVAIRDGRISRYARLDHFELLDILPKTSVGKIDKKALRLRFRTLPETAL